MSHLFPRYRNLIIFFLFIGYIPFSAQNTKEQKDISKQCMQKMKLVSDKVVLAKNNFEMPIPSEIIIDPHHSTITTNVRKPNKQENTVTLFIIKEIKCNMNEDITSGSITYTVKSNNPNSAYPQNGFILKATNGELSFFSSTDPADDTPVMPILKFEILK
ncbi:hypothetical protein WH221_14210 [Chryseobacterium culicis]|uniref:Uncharacterized protein n=1 Tax=Chryseobacterium culicis TaxID=680127 RepID=A0A2S9CRZ9_CHRCI|nr:hypothetical protein [Chryseobacterium culicis]PRB83262.1 hypothetical protein CQ022_14175 [Chryseobacterium culicis]PRB89504.1 hypothetical protein CQ033_13070 [Chryseobacterium culicis]